VTDRCRGNDGYASAVALAMPEVLALLCQHQAPSTAGRSGSAWIRISVDDGRKFLPRRQVPGELGPAVGAIVHYQLAAASSHVMLIAETGTTGSKLLFTGDGGRTWLAASSCGVANPSFRSGMRIRVSGESPRATRCGPPIRAARTGRRTISWPASDCSWRRGERSMHSRLLPGR